MEPLEARRPCPEIERKRPAAQDHFRLGQEAVALRARARRTGARTEVAIDAPLRPCLPVLVVEPAAGVDHAQARVETRDLRQLCIGDGLDDKDVHRAHGRQLVESLAEDAPSARLRLGSEAQRADVVMKLRSIFPTDVVPACRIISTSSRLRMSRTLSTPAWPKAASPQMYGRPMQMPLAPRASALKISVPRRNPPSMRTGSLPWTPSTTSGRHSIVPRPPSCARPPWFDTMIPSTPWRTASSASSRVSMPLSTSLSFVMSLSLRTTSHVSPGANMDTPVRSRPSNIGLRRR